MKKTQVSIITPCYNDGKYLPDAVESARESVESGFCEHIIVDDGSDDLATLDYYKTLDPKKVKLIFAGKVGLGNARNIGLAASKSDYYLNLDADNKIHTDYPVKAAAILNNNQDVGVVYSNLKYFGEQLEELHVGEFNSYKLLDFNYIDSCAVIRKQTWKDAGGYDVHEMLWEDWNFWLSVLTTRWKFHFINETLFEYRIRQEVSLRMTSLVRGEEVEKYLAWKHNFLFRKKYTALYKKNQIILNQLSSLEAENQQLKNLITGIAHSKSWKLTAPLRWLCRALNIR
jgi:glycosyltransferase involved in cell wall biosynthesis